MVYYKFNGLKMKYLENILIKYFFIPKICCIFVTVKLYSIDIKFKDSIDLLQKVLTLYSAGVHLNRNNENLRPRLIQILAFYVLKGYSSETKDLILDSIPELKKSNLNQINSDLLKLGYLEKGRYKNDERTLSKPLLELKQYLEKDSNGKPFIIFKLTKDEV